jgi:ketosteroid isomerase-like protein
MIARFGMGIAVVVLTGTPLRAQTVVRAEGDSAAMAEIVALEYHLIDLLGRRDLESYASYLAEDYLRINARGTISSKDEALTGFASTVAAGRQSPSDIEVRIYGDTAILSFVLTIEREGEPQQRNRLVKVFVRRDGRWIMVHNQGTPLE